MFASAVLEEAFLSTVVRCARQPGKPYEQWNLVLGVGRGLRRQVQVEGHVAARGLCTVAKLK